MKITGMTMEDRRHTHHETREPVVIITVDSPVEELTVPIKYGPKWRKIPCGPFTAVERWNQNGSHDTVGEWDDANREQVGTFNTLGYHHEQLVPVVVVSKEEGRVWLNMGVQRLRRLMRKHTPEYELIVDELSALNGRLGWRFELKVPVCFGDRSCRLPIVQSVWYSGAHVNLCSVHLAAHTRLRQPTR